MSSLVTEYMQLKDKLLERGAEKGQINDIFESDKISANGLTVYDAGVDRDGCLVYIYFKANRGEKSVPRAELDAFDLLKELGYETKFSDFRTATGKHQHELIGEKNDVEIAVRPESYEWILKLSAVGDWTKEDGGSTLVYRRELRPEDAEIVEKLRGILAD